MNWIEIGFAAFAFILFVRLVYITGFRAGKRYEKRRRFEEKNRFVEEMDTPIFKQKYGEGPLG